MCILYLILIYSILECYLYLISFLMNSMSITLADNDFCDTFRVESV